jgi:hypothetical protein
LRLRVKEERERIRDAEKERQIGRKREEDRGREK